MDNSEGDPGSFLSSLTTAYSGTDILWAQPGWILLIFILASAFMAFASRAFSELKEGNNNLQGQVQKLLLQYTNLQSSLFIAQTLLVICITATSIFWHTLIWANYPYSWLPTAFITVIVLFYLLVWLLTAMVYSSLGSLRFAELASYPSLLFRYIFYPVTQPFNSLIFKKKQKEEEQEKAAHVNIKDILVYNHNAPGVAEEKRILRGIMNFSSIYVRQIMRPRTDVVAHDVNTPFRQLCKFINENRYSRVPVYNGTLDKIAGILYVKDMLPYLNQKDNFNWTNLLREPYFVPENKKIDLLLQEFKRKKVHLAIVVDEYGGTSGIVTLEDILEEIVGEIHDEFDEEEVNYSRLDEDNFVFDGKTPLSDVVRIMDLDMEAFTEIKGDAETIGGLTIELSGAIPQPGQQLNHKDLRFTVETADGRRVRRVKISRMAEAASEIAP